MEPMAVTDLNIEEQGPPGPIPPAVQRAHWEATIQAGPTTLADGA